MSIDPDGLLRQLVWRKDDAAPSDDPEHGADLTSREWLVGNGLGGYASGTVCGAITRRFHGLLIAAMPSPLGRTMLLNHLADRVRKSGEDTAHALGEPNGKGETSAGELPLVEFRLEAGLPLWRYEGAGIALEKRVMLRYRQNTTQVTYALRAGSAPVCLELQPWLHFRRHEGAVDAPLGGPYALTVLGERYEIATDGMPALRLRAYGARAKFTIEGEELSDVRYRIEQSRGYDASGDLWSPGIFTLDLAEGSPVTLVASTESWATIEALTPEAAQRAEDERRRRLLIAAAPTARSGPAAELVLAADAFVISPAGRLEDTARAKAAGDEVRTVIAGYHWFTDWGRDTMISLEGLTLTAGRVAEAGYILRTFARYVKHGLIPNMFPEGDNSGLYHTADATLWFFHAVDRYLDASADQETLRLLLPVFEDIAAWHLRGTDFGIRIDPSDGLMTQGAPGYQLTWMDAKVGDYVVTPRRGKAVELNALWFNALKLLERWSFELRDQQAASTWRAHAERAQASFNRRFWCERGWLFDVVDGEKGDDASLRPNQIFAVALPNPILDPSRWSAVVDVVRRELLTPVGLRSLAPGSPDFKAKYFGDLRARDTAYHQGTVWAWLIGPFVDAYLRVHPDDKPGARALLQGFVPHLDEACVGQVSEIFDAEPPFTPRGCVAQAWSVAEVLRAWAKSAG